MVRLLVIAAVVAVAARVEADEAFFEKKVRPLLLEKCASCHGPEKQKGDLRVDSRSALIKGGERGESIVPGKPDESLLIRALSHSEELKMPPKAKLPASEIATLREWVRLGAPWPDSKPEPKVTAPAAAPRAFTAEEKAFWAFQPVRRPAVPNVKPSGDVRNAIDRFLRLKMEAEGVRPTAPADKRTLIRRLTFDLTGLPPTPAEVDRFLADNSPTAYEQLVDRLLASHAYGEKWARRWLDVARYADSNGMDENLAYVNAWRYRDWVIRSFNADKPYDQFVREQIAGDLLPARNEFDRGDKMTGTGFLVIGPKMLAEDDPMKMRMDIIDEQIDSIGQAFLGMTLGCARCHDHKFDPITMADYYGLAGIFFSTKTMRNYSVVAVWHERPIGTPEQAAALAKHDKQVDGLKAEITAIEKALAESTAVRLKEERKRAAEYLATAIEVHRRKGALKLVVADPGKNLPPGGRLIESEDFQRGNVLKLKDGYGAGIGVILNAGPTPNFSEHDVSLDKAGSYQLAIRFAAADSRPVRVTIDGKMVAVEACKAVSGSWYPDGQRWSPEAVVTLPAGKSVIRFERDGPFPHLDKFALIPMTAEQVATAPIAAEQAAAEKKLLASVLRQWVDLLGKRMGKAPMGEELAKLVAATDGPFQTNPAVEAEAEAEQKGKLDVVRAKLMFIEKARPKVDEVMAVEEDKGRDLRVHLRGNYLTLGAEAPRRFPRIMAGDRSAELPADRSGRRELAEWITRPDNPLTARVMANRIWLGHFGTGLVRSPDNFGRLGERPTHPELLDWLAAEFVESGWSIKHMHRLIVQSAAYRMSSAADPAMATKDPENRLYTHFNRRRLDAEEIRDGYLAVGGLLDGKAGGSLLTTGPRQYVTGTGNQNYEGYAHNCRSIYLPVIRSAVYDILQTLDFPDPSVPLGQRASTTIPTQALLMLNSGLVDQSAEAFAKSLIAMAKSDDERIALAYRRAVGRDPTPTEVETVAAYLQKSKGSNATGPLKAWRGFCRVLLASNEFVFVE